MLLTKRLALVVRFGSQQFRNLAFQKLHGLEDEVTAIEVE